MTTGTLNMASNPTSNATTINIGTNSTGTINIGSQQSTNRLGIFQTLGNSIVTTLTTTPLSLFTNHTANVSMFTGITTGNVSLFTGITSGTVNIGNTIPGSFTGIMNICSGLITGTVNIGSPSSTGEGRVKVQGWEFMPNHIDSRNATGNYEIVRNITTGNLYFGHGLTTGGLNLGPNESQTGNTYFRKPIVMSYPTLTLPMNAYAVGYTTTALDTPNPYSNTANAWKTARTLTLGVGCWILVGGAIFQSFTNWMQVSITVNNDHFDPLFYTFSAGVGGGTIPNIQVTRFAINTGSTTYYLTTIGGYTVPCVPYLYAMRIQ
jgi:hypothetical protein